MSLRGLMRNTAITSAATTISGILALLVVGIVVDGIGLVDYGLYTLAILFTARNGLLTIFDPGLQQVLPRQIARARAFGDSQREYRLTRAACGILFLIGSALTAGTLLIGISSVAAFIRVPEADIARFEAAITPIVMFWPIHFLGMGLSGALEGQERFADVKGWEVTTQFIQTVMLFIIGLSNPSLIDLTWTVAACQLLLPIGLTWSLTRSHKTPQLADSPSNSPKESQGFIAQACLLWLGKLSGMVSNHITRLAVQMLLGPLALGIFDLAGRVPNFLKLIVGFANAAVIPHASRMLAEGQAASNQQLFQRGIRYAAIVVLPITLAYACGAESFLIWWLGDEGKNITIWFTWALLSVPLASLIINFGSSILVGEGRHLTLLTGLGWALAAISVIIPLMILPETGLAGAIWARCLPILILLPMFVILMARSFGVGITGIVKANGIFICCIGLSVCAVYVITPLIQGFAQWMWIPQGFVGWLIATIIMAALCLHSGERRVLANLLMRKQRMN